MSDSTIRTGQLLFRLRSISPVPVIAVCLWLLWRSRPLSPPGGPTVDLVLDVVGIGCALLGQALRFYTLGYVPEGTSGQNLSIQASTLNTRGPYAYVRNPLYVGNLGIVLGLLLIANDIYVLSIGLLFFFGEYFFIIRAEENFLRGKFGTAFDEFCSKVPRWFPRVTAAYEGALRSGGFDWKRALKKESNPFTAWAVGSTILLAWEAWGRNNYTQTSMIALASVATIVVISFVIIKLWKKGWLFS